MSIDAVGDASDPFPDHGDVEMDEQAEAEAAQAEMGQQLYLVLVSASLRETLRSGFRVSAWNTG